LLRFGAGSVVDCMVGGAVADSLWGRFDILMVM
jgi:hypothetical protein